MEDIFRKIEDNIFETTTEKENIPQQKNNDLSEDTTEDSSKLAITKIIKKLPKTEAKNKNSNLFLEKIKNEGEKEEENIDIDEYADYGRVDKTGLHFQIISDYNVSLEIVPNELLRKDVKDLILKYKGVFDLTMNLWVIPYVNYEKLYNELYQIEGINIKLHKVGSIAKECYENKTLTTLKIKRKEKEETIDYLNDGNLERNIENLPKKLKNALYDFQIDGVNFGIEHHCRFLLADEMGVGKTIQAIALAYIYRDSWPVLIVCPGSMKYLWKGEIQNWLGLKDHRINMLNSSKQKISQEAYFYIISYDLVSHILKKLKKMTFDFVILDEAHSIKNKNSLRAKNILPIAIRAKRLILMTGTPLLAKPLEGYPLLYALRPDLFPYFKKYAYRYCDPQPTPFGINWSGTSNTKELHWILSTLMVRRLKKNVLNKLPPKRRQKVLIDTDPNIISQIKEARTKVKGRKGTLEAYTLTATAKKEGVCEYISDILESDEKIIVFAYHHEMLDRIELLMNEKNIDYIRIDGSTKQDKRYDYVRYFQSKKSCQVAILSIIAASTGITLNSAHIVIFAELTWTPSIMIQAEDRAHRIGQKSDLVDIKYLYGQETLDDFILDKLQKKLVIVSTTIDDKKENFGVSADPNLIHPEGKNSQELIKMDKGDFSLSDDDSSNDNDDVEEKLLKDLELALDIIDNNEKVNKMKNKKEKESFLNENNLEKKDNIESIAINSGINNINNNEISYPENDLNFDNFHIISNNINESLSQERKYPKSEKKINTNDKTLYLSNTTTKENNKIIYPKNSIKNLVDNEQIQKSINKNHNLNIKLRDKKENIEINSNNGIFNEMKSENPSNNKKIYPKREKTPNTTDGKTRHVKKLSAMKELKKSWASNNKKGKSVKKKKTHINLIQNSSNILPNTNNINIINNDKNDDKLIVIENPNNKEELNNNKNNLEYYEKNLLVNLHKINKRRSISQDETKQTRTYELDINNKSNEKFKTQQKRLLFPNNKNLFNENQTYYDNNTKLKLH